MHPTLRAGLSLLVLVAVAVAAVLGIGRARWRRTSRRIRHRIRDGTGPGDPSGATRRLAPEPVARLLARAAAPNRPRIRLARLEQEGEFLLRPPHGWAPFTATQLVRADPPAFLWDAAIRVGPVAAVRVRDAYVDGVGSMHAALAGLVPVVRAEGSPEMAEGSLYRYLAEAAWVPTRLRPGPSLRWTPIDRATARVTLTDAGTEVAVEVRFDRAGDIVGIYVPARPRAVDGGYRMTPWVGRFSNHEEWGGYRIPTRGEVAWVVDGEERPYWRGRIVRAVYETE